LPDGMYAYREFEIYLGEKQIGSCSTTWMVLDANTRRPKQVTFKNEVTKQLKGFQLSFQAQKIRLPHSWQHAQNQQVQFSDLDMNMHVNNLRYAEWVQNTIPANLQNNRKIAAFEINFLGECFLSETIACLLNDSDPTNWFFKGYNQDKDKLVFSARLQIDGSFQ
ncbi:MAG: thioesterase, partial [Flavobacteriaceae bacterium]|nr:thioesterase [Flavobacteriaceae bacterium]